MTPFVDPFRSSSVCVDTVWPINDVTPVWLSIKADLVLNLRLQLSQSWDSDRSLPLGEVGCALMIIATIIASVGGTNESSGE